MPQATDRQSKLTIGLGNEQVDIVRMEATESLSQPFIISLDILSTLGEIDLLPHLGKPATIAVMEDGTLLRHFNGIVVDGEFQSEDEGGRYNYRLTLRPKAYLHEQGRYFRIFQEMTVKAILEKTLNKCNIAADFSKLAGGSRVRSFCVQYGESDFAFISRLMEEEGIYYFYKHTEDQHILFLCDGPGSHVEGEASPLVYNPMSSTVFNTDSAARFVLGQTKYLQSWHERVSTGAEAKVTFRDFDFKRPAKSLEVEAEDEGLHPEDEIEIYNYPGRYFKEGEGKNLSKIMLEARRASRRLYFGESQIGSIACGTTFKVQSHTIDRLNASYLITHCHHSVSTEQYRSGGGGADGLVVRIEAVPADTTWRAPLVTRRPLVAGPETAIVTGPPGEEIHVDKYGRVTVQFHWDRDGKKDDHSSCWIRVSQTGGLGNIIIPRVGHEVLVDFINGNPDRPIIVGRVFNEQHMPVYPLPANKTRQVWRSWRYGKTGDYGPAKALDTGKPGVNEIRWEDKGGKEEFFVHAERDMNTRVRHNETHHVGANQIIDIGYDRTEAVKRHETITIGKNQTETIGVDQTIEVKNNRKTKIGVDDKLEVGSNLKIKAGTNIEIEAGSQIQLKVGSSTITMDKTSVTIKTMDLKMEGATSASLKSLQTDVSGSVQLVAKGGIVMIN
jgi:type VI secretion system secreted protein VgrG